MLRQIWLLVALTSLNPLLHAAPPSVERVFPAAGSQGTEFTLTLTGSGLQNAAEVLLYDGEIRCTRIEPGSDTELLLQFSATTACRPGMHAFRIRSAEGLSELHVFGISSLPVVSETESNDAITDAQQVSANVTIVGTLDAADTDNFRVSLKKGDRLSADAEAMRAGGAMLDAVLNVLGPSGEWLVSVDDTPLRRQDPVVSLVIPADGDYVVQLHESNFEGDESCRYSLHVGTFSSPAWVFPPGGPAGTTVGVTFGGDAAGPVTQQIDLQDAVPGTLTVFPRHNERPSPTGLPFRVSEFGNVVESEPNQSAADVASVASDCPIALNGLLQEPGDIDCFRIRAQAGQKVEVEVFASRLGSPVDARLEILDSEGLLIGASDDGLSHDSHLAVVFPDTAEYLVRISDKRGNGGDGWFYRVELSPFQPRLTAFLSRPDRRSQERQSISVPRGNRVLTFLACQRTGMAGDVRLTASGLPTGVSLPDTLIPADRFWVPIVMEAADDAPLTGTLADVEVSGTSGERSVNGHFRQIVDLVAASADQLFQSAEVDRLAVAVVEEVPWDVTLHPPATSLAPDGTLDLKLTVRRKDGFDGPLEIRLPFLPPWVDGPDTVVVPGDQEEAVYPLRAWPQAVPRTWTICAEARAAIDTTPKAVASPTETRSFAPQRPLNRAAVASRLVDLSIQPTPVSGAMSAVVTEQGKPARATCTLHVTGTLPESLTAVLEGLPNRVSANSVTVRPNDSSIQFNVQLDETAPVGTFSDLVVRLIGQQNDQAVSWRIARGSVLKIEQAGKLLTGDDGQPLTRLEALRRRAKTPTPDRN